jgi:hypothetical protein
LTSVTGVQTCALPIYFANTSPCMRLEVSMAMKICIAVLWVMNPCCLAGRYECFEGTYCLHLQGTSEWKRVKCFTFTLKEAVWKQLQRSYHYHVLFNAQNCLTQDSEAQLQSTSSWLTTWETITLSNQLTNWLVNSVVQGLPQAI